MSRITLYAFWSFFALALIYQYYITNHSWITYIPILLALFGGLCGGIDLVKQKYKKEGEEKTKKELM